MCYSAALGRHGYNIVSRGGLVWVESRALADFPWLLHAFSTRSGGFSKGTARGLNLGFIAADSRAHVLRNRREFLSRLGAAEYVLASLRQTHSVHIYQVAKKRKTEYRPSGYALPEPPPDHATVGDALVTDEPEILLSVRVADCLPILLVDPRRRAVAAVHAGWRGTLARIAEKTVAVMRLIFGSDPRDLHAAIGPGIRSCCYAVGEEVVAAFCGRFVNGEQYFHAPPPRDPADSLATKYPLLFLARRPPGHLDNPIPAAHLDLVAATTDQLQTAGLRASRIHAAEYCTACRTDLFFSHRREGAHTGRSMAVIGIRPGKD
ncbi:MAG: peptidoglycan editing factor PgeF [Terriglobia bacterium]